MPDWTSNVVKIYVPAELEPLIGRIVSALAHPGIGEAWVDGDAPDVRGRWIDFERLCPTATPLSGGRGGIERQEALWGTKWNVDEIEPPRVYPAVDHDALHDHHGCTVIDYGFDTAWTEPTGYMATLAEWCRRLGLGLQWWHDLDEPAFNPRTNETDTQWVEDDDVRVDPAVLPMVEQCALLTGGIPAGPADTDRGAPNEMEGRAA